MTRTPTTAQMAEAANLAATLGPFLSTAPHTISHLHGAIDRCIEDGIRAARYDGDGGSGGSGEVSSPTEGTLLARQHHRDGCERDETCRCPDRFSDKASEDLQALEQSVLRVLPELRLWRRLVADYGLDTAVGPRPCPAGKCRAHWSAGIPLASSKRYADLCSRCGKHRAERGYLPPELVLREAQEHGWDSWRVWRAYESLGLNTPVQTGRSRASA